MRDVAGTYNLDLRDVVAQFKVNRETARQWAVAGLLDGVKVKGIGWRFSQEGLDNFLEACRAEQTA